MNNIRGMNTYLLHNWFMRIHTQSGKRPRSNGDNEHNIQIQAIAPQKFITDNKRMELCCLCEYLCTRAVLLHSLYLHNRRVMRVISSTSIWYYYLQFSLHWFQTNNRHSEKSERLPHVWIDVIGQIMRKCYRMKR